MMLKRSSRAGGASTTSRSSPPTWTRPSASTTGCSAPGWSPPSARPTFRHYFFEFGPEQTVAFFEYRGVELDTFAKPAGVPDPRAIQFDHLSFNLPDEEALESLRAPAEGARLRGHRRRRPPASCARSTSPTPTASPSRRRGGSSTHTGRDADYGDRRSSRDPNPVPAVRELAEHRRAGRRRRDPPRHAGDEIADPAVQVLLSQAALSW